jgi:hypothetical protein
MNSTKLLSNVLTRLERVTGPDQQSWCTAICPFHDDRNPSLRISPRGFTCMGCGEKGNLGQLAAKLGLANHPPGGNWVQSNQWGVTLRQLAQAKGLPLEVLRNLGWHDVEYQGQPAVAIPYQDAKGNLLREQLRIHLEKGHKKDGRFVWAPGRGIWPLGLDRLQAAREAGYLFIVEGPTDFAACICGGIPALAIPGANTWRQDWEAYLADIPRIFVWHEGDLGGEALVRAIARSRPDPLVVAAPPEAKDPCALRQLDPAGFPQRIAALLAEAKPPELGSSTSNTRSASTGDLKVSSSATSPGGSMADRAIKYVLDSGAEHYSMTSMATPSLPSRMAWGSEKYGL